MSDWVQFVVDESVGAADAPILAERVRDRLIATGWIAPARGPDPVLHGDGHRPGPDVGRWYARSPGEADLSAWRTNGVAIEAGPFSNLVAGPFDVDLLTCPACAAPVDLPALQDEFERWVTSAIEPHATCAPCGHVTHARGLRGVVCGHLALTFYNWPPLDDDRWSRKVMDVVSESLGTRPAIANAKL